MRRQRGRLESRRQTFELIQSDLEVFTETLSGKRCVCLCVCVCMGEREWEERVCVCVWARENERRAWVCVSVREKEWGEERGIGGC